MKRGGPLRRTPLRRKGWGVRWRRRSRYARRKRDLPYMAWVKTLPCSAYLIHACRGDVEAHHAGDHGLGRKPPDDTCIPLCDAAHDAWHDALPPFRGWSKEQRRAWVDTMIQRTRAQWAAREEMCL